MVKKSGLSKLKSSNAIPEYFKIEFPDGKIRKIMTDVEQTGKPHLHLSVVKKPNANGSNEIGTIGVFLKDANNTIFGLTNYHVAGWNNMLRNEFYFNGSDNNVFIDGISCVFEEGIISNEIDVAFIKIGGNVQVNNQLSSEVQISDYVEGPITSDAINQVVNVYVNKEPGIKSSKVGNNSAIFYSGFRDIALEDVLMLDPVVTNKGNSGCPVMIDDSLLGIIVGGDSKYSYAIPYFKIKNFKPLDIL